MVKRVHTTTRIAFLGPTPPPVMGPAIATSIVLSETPPPDIELIHLDTADRRSLATLGRIDFGNIWQAIKMYCGLFAIILRYRPHLVYIPISQTKIGFSRDSILIVIAWIFRRKIALHLRGGNFRDFTRSCGWMLRGWVKWSLRRARGIIVLGDCLKEQFTPFVQEDRIHVVPNGEDFPEFEARHRPARRRGLHVAYLGNMIPLKGPGDLLQAVPGVLAKHAGTRFSFAGSWRNPEFESWARDYVKRWGLGGSVEFLGPVDRARKTELLRDADLFVFPSTREGH
ncbi:MAG: glycosyltransferase family 4 protein, partial [Planctomycetota bacterium]|nr:glycosyltransferase family 4 protein [Planctomycetota bacterium]